MRQLSLFLSLAIIITACGAKKGVPGDVLPPDRMEAVMWDMMRADQFLADYVLNKDTSKKKEIESIRMYQQIFGFHKITKAEFEKSFAYYRTHLSYMQAIMDTMSKRKLVIPPPAVLPGADTSKKPADTTIRRRPPAVPSGTDTNEVPRRKPKEYKAV